MSDALAQRFDHISCPICTYLNDSSVQNCLMCTYDLTNVLSRSEQDVVIVDDKDEDEEDGQDEEEEEEEKFLITLAKEFVDDLVDEVVDDKGKKRYECKIDQRQCSNLKMMFIYLSCYHKQELLKYYNKKKGKKTQQKRMVLDDYDNNTSFSSSTRSISDLDAQLAFEIAWNEYDDVVDKKKLSLARSEKKRNSLKKNNKSDSQTTRRSYHDNDVNTSTTMRIYEDKVKVSYSSRQEHNKKTTSTITSCQQERRNNIPIERVRGNRMTTNDSLLMSSSSSFQSSSRAPQVDFQDTLQYNNNNNNNMKNNKNTSLFYSDKTNKLFTKEDKERRLQKLLSKADQIIKHLDTLIKPVNTTTRSVESTSGVTSSSSSTTSQSIVSERNVNLVKQPMNVTNCTLRDYQLTGVQWLLGLYSSGLNGILADGKIIKHHIRHMNTLSSHIHCYWSLLYLFLTSNTSPGHLIIS